MDRPAKTLSNVAAALSVLHPIFGSAVLVFLHGETGPGWAFMKSYCPLAASSQNFRSSWRLEPFFLSNLFPFFPSSFKPKMDALVAKLGVAPVVAIGLVVFYVLYVSLTY